jgi:Amt family ammonium transporter
MPVAHLPLLGWLGALLMVIGWLATTDLAHLPAGLSLPVAMSATNLVLAVAGAACATGVYAWLATGRLDMLMAGRGMVAGLVVAAAGAPFLPTWATVVAGILVGLAVPPVLFLCDRRVQASPGAVLLAVFGLPSVLGLLLPGLLGDGRYGSGWNRVGGDSYLGVPGQGVSGAWVAAGMAVDWPGQMVAQLIGAVSVVVWTFVVIWLALAALAAVIRGWRRSGLEFGTPPAPVPPADDSPDQTEFPSSTGALVALSEGGPPVPEGGARES